MPTAAATDASKPPSFQHTHRRRLLRCFRRHLQAHRAAAHPRLNSSTSRRFKPSSRRNISAAHRSRIDLPATAQQNRPLSFAVDPATHHGFITGAVPSSHPSYRRRSLTRTLCRFEKKERRLMKWKEEMRRRKKKEEKDTGQDGKRRKRPWAKIRKKEGEEKVKVLGLWPAIDWPMPNFRNVQLLRTPPRPSPIALSTRHIQMRY